MIERDPAAAQVRPYDLIIVGGGIHGACIALESARRGLRPLLLERRDFGGGASAQTLRIIHGGLRYLQSLDLGRFRRSVEQRRWWLSTFPALVRPMPCLMPLYGKGMKRSSVLRSALWLNDILSVDRNDGLSTDSRIPRSRLLCVEKTRDLFPGCDPNGLQGGALWYDGSMVSPQRLIMEMLRWTCASGGVVLNYVSARELISHCGRVQGVQALDEIAGASLEFLAPVVVNAAGSSVGRLGGTFDPATSEFFHRSLAFNVLLRRKLPATVPIGVSVPSTGGPTYFLRPRGDFTLAGTFHAPWKDSDGDAPRASEALLTSFLSQLGRAIPGFTPFREDVVRVFPGFLPTTDAESVEPIKNPMVIDHEASGGPSGLFSVSGEKFTTAPGVANRLLDRLFGRQKTVDSGGSMNDGRPVVRSWPEAPRTLAEATDWKSVLADALPEIRRIVREEAVMFADDLLWRRLDWGMSGLDLEEVAHELHRILPEIPAGVHVEDALLTKRIES